MKLREYLDNNIMQIREFMRVIGVTEHTVHNWLSEEIPPLRLNQLKIEKFTNGQVTLEDWGIYERKKKANRRVRSSENNEVRPGKHLDVDKKAKLKSSKAKR